MPPAAPGTGQTAPGPVPDGAADGLRAAFRRAASSVWVVASAAGGAPAGFTAISVASVSVTPPLLSFNVGAASTTLAVLRSGGRYAVHLLAEGQEDLARRFAGPAAGRFADAATWRWGADGLPELAGTTARLAGHVTALVPAGDSVIVVGDVRTVSLGAAAPLVHHDRSYGALAPADRRLRATAP